MYRLYIILAGTLALLVLSWRALRHPGSHGFFRFFAWDAILVVIAMNLPYWFYNPFSWHQLLSWFLLCCSIYPGVMGFYLLRKIGRPSSRKGEPANYAFENTGNLVTQGLYKYVRHPLYCSLLLLVWGACFKYPDIWGLITTVVASLFLFATARAEERENIRTFGSQYVEYMNRSKMFIPFLI